MTNQPLDVNGKDLSSDALGHATDLLDGKTKLSNVNSNINIEEEIKESIMTSSEKCTVQNSSLKPQVKKTAYLETAKPLDVTSKDSSSDVLGHAADILDERTKLCNFDSYVNIGKEIKESTIASTEKCTVRNLSLKPLMKKTDYVETAKLVERSNIEASKHAAGYSNGNKELIGVGSKIMRKEEKEKSSTPSAKIMILDSSSKPGEKRTDLEGKVKPAITSVNGLSSDALRHGTSCVNNDKNSSKTDSKVVVKKEVIEQSSTPIDKGGILSSLESEAKRTDLHEIDKPANTKDTSSDALKHTTGLDGKKRMSNSGDSLNALKREKSGDSCIKPKLSKSTSKTTRKGGVKDSKIAPVDKIDSSLSSLKTENKRMNPRGEVKVHDANLSDTENSGVTSLLELQVQGGNDTSEPQPKEGKPQSEVQKVDTATSDLKSLKTQKQQSKRKSQSNLLGVQEAYCPPTESGSNSFSISEANVQWESKFGDDNATLSQFLNGKILKKLVHPDRCRTEECSVAPDVVKDSVSSSQKKRKKSSDPPMIVEIETLPTPRYIDLNDLTVVDLKAIAKQQELAKFSKLLKCDLVRQLADHFKQKKDKLADQLG